MKNYCWESIGERAESLLGLSGTVSMAGSRGVYCEMENRNIFLIHDAEYGIVPFGIGVNDISGFIQKACIGKGTRVVTDRNRVDFLKIGAEARVRIIRGKQEVKRRENSHQPKSPEEIKSCMGIMKILISQYGSSTGLGRIAGIPFSWCELNVFCRTALPAVEKLSKAVKADEKERIREAVLRIAGLGPGLTPSGDDFLVGYLLLFSFAVRMGLEVPEGYQTLKDIFRKENFGRQITSVISNAYLESAAAGEDFSIVSDVLKAALSKNGGDTRDPVIRMLQAGSSSGTDILCGIIWALQTLFYTGEGYEAFVF